MQFEKIKNSNTIKTVQLLSYSLWNTYSQVIHIVILQRRDNEDFLEIRPPSRVDGRLWTIFQLFHKTLPLLIRWQLFSPLPLMLCPSNIIPPLRFNVTLTFVSGPFFGCFVFLYYRVNIFLLLFFFRQVVCFPVGKDWNWLTF